MGEVPAGDPVAVTLPATVASATRARDFARAAVVDWQVTGAADDIVFVVHELVTNAIIHGRGQIHLSLAHHGDVVRIDVADESAELPVKRRASQTRDGGRGIALVSAIARAWGTSPGASGGKSVWADIAVRGPGTV